MTQRPVQLRRCGPQFRQNRDATTLGKAVQTLAGDPPRAARPCSGALRTPYHRFREVRGQDTRRLRVVAEGIAGASAIAFTILLSPLLRPWYRRWGATLAEVASRLPGDELVPHPRSELTLATTIKAPAAAVWPWLLQLGCQRGGWYSYDLLDNGGCPSADRVLPQFQRLEVGDIVAAVPSGSFGFSVAAIAAGRALTLAGTLDTRTGQPANPAQPGLDAYFSGDQTFAIEPLENGHSRFLFRMRTDWNHSTLNTLIYRGILEPVSFVMGRKMLINIKRRAENRASRRAA